MIHTLYLNDISSDAVGAWLERAPDIPIAAERGTWQTIPGTDGELFVSEGALSPITLDIQLYVEHDYDREKVIDWIMKAETVRVYPWPWEWHVRKEGSAPTINEWMDDPDEGLEIGVTLKCDPYRYVWPHEKIVKYTANGTYTLRNEYNASCRPIIRIEKTTAGTAAMKVTINGTKLSIAGKSGEKIVIVDCEKKTVLSADGTSAASRCEITGSSDAIGGRMRRWPELAIGDNEIVVNVTNISSVTIDKRSRRR